MISRPAVIAIFGLWLSATAFGLWMYPSLPNPAPIHWNLHGQADGYGPSWVNVALMPLVSLALFGLLLGLPLLGPFRENFEQFRRAYAVICVALMAALAALHVIIVLKSGGSGLPIGASIATVIGLLLVVLGNTFGKIRRNFYVGIRTPWTLANEVVWEKTHRLGGRLFVASGLITVVAAWFAGELVTLIVLLGGVCASSIWAIVYSYRCYRDLGAVDDLSPRPGQ